MLRDNPQLGLYVQMLLEQGDKLGLTAFREAEPIWSELIEDSASATGHLPREGKILDLGSGGGCPGVVLQILRPDTRFSLLEANGRKAGFLREVVQALGLPSEVLQDRSELIAHQIQHRACYDQVVAKAVAPLPTLIELALPLLKTQGCLLAYKGPQADKEIADSATALRLLGGELLPPTSYCIGQKSYAHVHVRKVTPTPKAYPRRPGIPAKQPLSLAEN